MLKDKTDSGINIKILQFNRKLQTIKIIKYFRCKPAHLAILSEKHCTVYFNHSKKIF